ncbi:cytochrome c oxidase subunit II [Pseudonocardiaceae bacterium YIM PH 21723]|nr:cytochrome c oxidase subunit II [Pseudonocardiaceae bacterium YIM PH 21723]
MRLAKVAMLVSLVGIAATGCSSEEVLRFGWPKAVTEQGERMRELWTGSVIAALIVGVLVWALIFWSVAFHRKRKNSPDMPRQTQYNLPLEIGLTVLPMIIIVVLFYYAVVTQNFVNKKIANPDVKVDVVATQWNWVFSYPETKTANGEVVRTSGDNATIPLLVLPTSKTIQYTISSGDVIHSFFVPEFNFKRDVFPRPEKNNTDNVFQNKIDREGAFIGHCAELCGTYHGMMNFEVRALSPDKFDRYMKLRASTNPKTAKPYSAAEALTEMNCGDLCKPEAVTTYPFTTKRDARTPSERGETR